MAEYLIKSVFQGNNESDDEIIEWAIKKGTQSLKRQSCYGKYVGWRKTEKSFYSNGISAKK